MIEDELYNLEKCCRNYYNNLQKDIVFGQGKSNSKVILIGEAPGGQEIKEGKPFVGQAGENLNLFLQSVEIERKDLYITNVVKFRPIKINEKSGRENNRTPNWEEILEGLPFLIKEIDIIKPKVIVTLGNIPLRAITGNKSATIGKIHGQASTVNIDNREYTLFPLYHPASIIYNSSLKDTYHEDLIKLRKIIANQVTGSIPLLD